MPDYTVGVRKERKGEKKEWMDRNQQSDVEREKQKGVRETERKEEKVLRSGALEQSREMWRNRW